MSGAILLFVFLILLACYGLYVLSHRLLRRFFPNKHNITLYIALGIAFCFFAAAAFGAAGALTQVRSQAFSQGLAEANAQQQEPDIADEARLYSDAYTQGYTDAIDTYIENILASALKDIQAPDADAEDTDPGEDPEEGSDPTDQPETDDPPDDAGDTGRDNPVPPTGTTVYYTKSGSVLHRNRSCSYLKNASEILSCDSSQAPNRPYCSRCG